MNKLAYLILVHNDPEHFAKLVGALDYRSDIFIHVDAKVDEMPFRKASEGRPVHFVENRKAVFWGGFQMIEATMELCRAAFQSGEPYTHLVLLSGSHFPLKRPAAIWEFFQAHKGKPFLKLYDLNDSDPDHSWRTRHYFFRDAFGGLPSPPLQKWLRRVLEMLAYPLPRLGGKGVRYCFGSQWWALPPDFMLQVFEAIEKHPGWCRFFRKTFAPDELFFHTIVANSELAARCGGVQPARGVHFPEMAELHALSGSGGTYFTEKDADRLLQSGKLFCRKVASKESGKLAEHLQSEF
jgi:hypothetical protein